MKESKSMMVKHEKKEMASKSKKYAKGGSVSARADGIAKKGKTKGTMVKMNKGGMAC